MGALVIAKKVIDGASFLIGVVIKLADIVKAVKEGGEVNE